jgi:hypothetical protein
MIRSRLFLVALALGSSACSVFEVLGEVFFPSLTEG